ncbi:MAG: ankyrin repeat domain-containing protein [Candidatus Hydrogenedentes bacterium]|nr:ankyrin repeat domain-containing protein [Candidatus Hydrogenedentota bacterium]
MKRGDYTALLLFVLQAGIAFWYARLLAPFVPPLGDSYFQVPLSPLSEALSGLRTLGYPLFHAFVAGQGHGLPAYPEAQMLLLLPCVLVFGLGLRAYGLTGPAALVAASPLIWIVPVAHVIPETPAKCFAIAAAGFLLWFAGTRTLLPCIGLALSIFLAYQMRPAFLFLVAWVPAAWILLYTRRWGRLHQVRWLGQFARCMAACVLPLLLFSAMRLVLVGHFGLVSFGGQNTIGISIEMLDSQTVSRLPAGERPLGQVFARGREAWPDPRFLTRKGLRDDWNYIAPIYAANVNRIGRTLQAKFPPVEGAAGNVERDQAMSRLSLQTFLVEWPMYGDWLAGAAVESFRMALVLLLGGGRDEGFGLGPDYSLVVFLALIVLALLSWPVERRAFGEGSRPFFSRAATVLLFLSGTFFLTKMLLVILVEPPIARYVEAAAYLLPCVLAALYWDRAVILAAALCGRPHWYNQCYVAYPAVPDTAHTPPWRLWASRARLSRRVALSVLAAVALAVLVMIWTSRDARLFHALATDPESVRDRLLQAGPPVAWRGDDGATLLHYAALQGDVELVRHLIAEGADPGATTRDGAQALHWATLGKGDGAVVPPLLAAGLSPQTAGPLGLSPLHLAALFGNTGVLAALMDGGADPNVRNKAGVVPLHLVDSVAAATVLLARGAAVDAADLNGATPFLWAHNRELAEFFLRHGANINAREDWRSFIRRGTPLLKAAYHGDYETAHWLLERGADPNAGDINDFSAVYYAIWRGNTALLQLLLDRGADPMHPGRWMAYHSDALTERFTDIIGKTVGTHEKRASFHKLVHDEARMHPLDWAAFLGNTRAMEVLIARGARLDTHNEYGMSAIHWAILGNRGPAEKLLRARDPGLAQLDDARLPVRAFRAAVLAGKRNLGPIIPPPAREGNPAPAPPPSG